VAATEKDGDDVNSNGQNLVGFYDGWRLANDRLSEMIGSLTREQLALRPAPNLWPIWATTAHVAGVRVYWLCTILKEPGAERTPFDNPTGEGWEDDLTHPRDSSELTSALASTWQIVQRCLERWTPEMLQEGFRRERDGQIQIHSRQSVLMRMITHDGYHCGEISQTLGIHGMKELDIWTGRARLSVATTLESKA
jgi:uncharacterized damage-inducible protein DinB